MGMHIILFFLSFLLKDSDEMQPPAEPITGFEYQVMFNLKFDRDQKFTEYKGVMYATPTATDFFMVTNLGNNMIPLGQNEIRIEKDTMFRVRKDFDKDVMIFSDLNLQGNDIYYRDTIHPMRWELSEETKMIDSLECHKAETVFRGRRYTAWFCPAIELPFGPWKLGGLPGLIVEAYENKKDIYFLLKKLGPVLSEYHTPAPPSTSLQGYPEHQKYWRNVKKVMRGTFQGKEDSDCISCLTRTDVQFFTWEIIPE